MQGTRLILFAPWFGPWPAWINLTLESCRFNPDVTWAIPTDQPPSANHPPNVHFLPMSLADFAARAADVVGRPITPENAYKICDFKPLTGEIFADEIAQYTHFGTTDLDIIYGQLSCELTPERLARHEIISGQGFLQAGHLSIYRNTRRIRRAWRIWGARRILSDPEHQGFDDRAFSKSLHPARRHLPWRRYKVLWHEMYSTPDGPIPWADGGPSPTRFHWRAGHLSDERGAKDQYAYLHFMHWRSGRYRRGGTPAPWQGLDKLAHMDWRDMAQNGLDISHAGFIPANFP